MRKQGGRALLKNSGVDVAYSNKNKKSEVQYNDVTLLQTQTYQRNALHRNIDNLKPKESKSQSFLTLTLFFVFVFLVMGHSRESERAMAALI